LKTSVEPGRPRARAARTSARPSFAALLPAALAAALIAGCGGGGGGSSPTAAPATSTTPTTTAPTTGTGTTAPITAAPADSASSNVVPVLLDAGPAAATSRLSNMPYVSVTVCAPGTGRCQTVDHVVVDTGSSGLRIVASALADPTVLPLQSNAAGNPYGHCAQFVSGYTWGSVRVGDVALGGLTVPSLPLQIIGDRSFASVPSGCAGTGVAQNSVDSLGANGILGVGYFRQDCGTACATQVIPGTYYACPAGTNCTASTIPVAQQVAHPSTRLSTDNNGVLVQLPAVPDAGATNVQGSLVFGIGTRANNALENATVYGVDRNTGYLTTVYNGRSYPRSFIDSGSNFYFFEDTAIPTCGNGSSFYCPSATLTLGAINQGTNGASGTVRFTIANARSVFSANPNATAIPNIGARFSGIDGFDWGLPFFFGRRVFTALEGAATPGGTGPYVAY